MEVIGPRKIKIIDRVKNFFKLSQGEFISPEKVENIFIQCEYVSQVRTFPEHSLNV